MKNKPDPAPLRPSNLSNEIKKCTKISWDYPFKAFWYTLLQHWICIQLVPGSGSIFGMQTRIGILIWNTDPDPHSSKRLDPDSYKVNADPKHCLLSVSLLEWKKIFKESTYNRCHFASQLNTGINVNSLFCLSQSPKL
jgi:hypothetical protein